MALTLPTVFTVVAQSGQQDFRIERIIGQGGEWEALVDNMMWGWAYLACAEMFQWGDSLNPLETTSLTLQDRLEGTFEPSAERFGNTGSVCNFSIDHAGGSTRIEIWDNTGGTLLAAITDATVGRSTFAGSLAMSNALADDVLILVRTLWDNVTGTEHLLYGVWVQEAPMLLTDM